MKTFFLTICLLFFITKVSAKEWAHFQGGVITDTEVEASLKVSLHELRKQEYQLRKQKLEEILFEKLLSLEAEQRKVTEEKLIEKEITAKVERVSQKEIHRFYEERKAQLPQGKDFYAKQIEQFLGQQKMLEARTNYFEKLKKKYKVAMFLEEPQLTKIDVAVGASPRKGPEKAPITLVEFSDFQCPFCAKLTTTLSKVYKEYPNKIRWVFKHFPLPSHAQATGASMAALCAEEEGQFWPFHDRLFANQNKLTADDLVQHAQALKLDVPRFKSCFDEKRHLKQVTEDSQYGKSLGIQSTPTFFINGQLMVGAQDEQVIRKIIDQELRK